MPAATVTNGRVTFDQYLYDDDRDLVNITHVRLTRFNGVPVPAHMEAPPWMTTLNFNTWSDERTETRVAFSLDLAELEAGVYTFEIGFTDDLHDPLTDTFTLTVSES